MAVPTLPKPPAARGAAESRLHVSLLALPDAVVATPAGIYDVMNTRALMGSPNGQAGGSGSKSSPKRSVR
jgi:hypothetical protein